MMADDLPFRKDRGTQSTGEPVGALKPFNEAAQTQGGAPAGDFFGSDLPVYAISDQAQNPFKEGFNPTSENPPLPDDPMKGYTYPPGQGRR